MFSWGNNQFSVPFFCVYPVYIELESYPPKDVTQTIIETHRPPVGCFEFQNFTYIPPAPQKHTEKGETSPPQKKQTNKTKQKTKAVPVYATEAYGDVRYSSTFFVPALDRNELSALRAGCFLLLPWHYNSDKVLAFSTISFHLRRSWTCSAQFISLTL